MVASFSASLTSPAENSLMSAPPEKKPGLEPVRTIAEIVGSERWLLKELRMLERQMAPSELTLLSGSLIPIWIVAMELIA